MFDLDELRKKCDLTGEELQDLKEQIAREYPDDDMMIELHVVRILERLEKGKLSKEQAFTERTISSS